MRQCDLTTGGEESAKDDPEETAVFLNAKTGADSGQEQGSRRADQGERGPAPGGDSSVPARDSALTAAMCDREQEGPDGREPGEGKTALLEPGPRPVGVASMGPRAEDRGARSYSARPGLEAFFLPKQGQSSPWGQCCGLRAPQSCSCPLPLALSPAACVLCRRAEADPDICGDKLEKYGLYAHLFCLYFATLLFQQANKRVGLLGFLHQDIQLAVRRAAQKHCCVCGQSGATILCWKEDCNRWFHLPCAKEGGCITQYITPYRSYCPEHRPVQIVQVTPELGTECPICMEPVEDRKTFKTMVCPVCKRAWFHRDCLQGQALCAGLLHFRCPLCRDHETFLVEMFVMGIRIPIRLVSFCVSQKTRGCKCRAVPGPAPVVQALSHPGRQGSRNTSAFPFSIRQPTWEDNNAFADLGERHGRCNVRECLYPRGREEAEEEGPWELLLCSSCAAEGTHRRCSGLTVRTTHWECDSCAGLGTGMRQSSRVSLGWGQGPGRAWQSPWAPGGLGEVFWSVMACSRPGRPLTFLFGLTGSRDEPELNGPSLISHSGLESSQGLSESEATSPSSSSPVSSGLAPHSPSPEASSHSSPQHSASSLADTGSPSTSRPRHSSSMDPEDRVHSRHAGPDRRRNRSRQQSQAPNRHIRSRSHRNRSRRTRPRAERPRQRQTPSRAALEPSFSKKEEEESETLPQASEEIDCDTAADLKDLLGPSKVKPEKTEEIPWDKEDSQDSVSEYHLGPLPENDRTQESSAFKFFFFGDTEE
ncbi:uncharacterized protein LOC117244298 [Parus major]|uniref:uncharacterized protein LOC117244298 n=1 Tax=Parus major TaxID=9157 RepID=UPI001443B47A|nr:uncharacterized protein LOC117244298 [Parus major]